LLRSKNGKDVPGLIKYREKKTYEEVAVKLQAFLAFRDSRLPRRCG
jgi:hypothetical protein